jgi:hypothetical protein
MLRYSIKIIEKLWFLKLEVIKILNKLNYNYWQSIFLPLIEKQKLIFVY